MVMENYSKYNIQIKTMLKTVNKQNPYEPQVIYMRHSMNWSKDSYKAVIIIYF